MGIIATFEWQHAFTIVGLALAFAICWVAFFWSLKG